MSKIRSTLPPNPRYNVSIHLPTKTSALDFSIEYSIHPTAPPLHSNYYGELIRKEINAPRSRQDRSREPGTEAHPSESLEKEALQDDPQQAAEAERPCRFNFTTDDEEERKRKREICEVTFGGWLGTLDLRASLSW